ncbi:DUF2784 family protein [Leptospira sp. GIMC2001]|uniref:DUF2784 family protein n=1 Tax=Leptospira sp. GIMC2001 TaxID=1513297 RepID=UPI002349B480|nr:DUF2784 family protein [Leptospira sp. GIMC2001]WCL47746.1 DUF2784 family protein [Leptospira sp. GIMC2001]
MLDSKNQFEYSVNMEKVTFLWIINIVLFQIHSFVIVINLFAWMSWKFRKLHYAVISLTIFSWIVLGFFYGFGYCFLTDWHYDILRDLGYSNLPYSYIKFCLDSIFGSDLNPFYVDIGTVIGFVIAVAGAVNNLLWRRN